MPASCGRREDAEAVGGRDDAVDAGALGDAHGNRVDRLRQCPRQAHLPLIAPAVVVRPPVADADGGVVEHVARPETGFEAREIDEGLERRAGLPLGFGRAVELTFRVIAAADHRAHRAVGRQRNQRALAYPVASAIARQDGANRGHPPPAAGRRIKRRRDDEVAIGGAGEIVHLVGDPIGEIARSGMPGGRPIGAAAFGFGGGGAADEASLDHVVEHLRSARRRGGAVARPAEPARRLEQPGDGGALIEVELRGRLAEIAVRRCIDAVGAGAEIGAVQIDFEV